MSRYITPQGHRRLVDEYETLLKVERPRITAEVAYAASLGDRSENAEYIYGKKRLREIDGRLHHLQKKLEQLEVFDPGTLSGPVVRFGAIVTVADAAGQAETWQVVGEEEADVDIGRISYTSPLGRALVGRQEGDEVRVQAPGGARVLDVVEVRYPEPFTGG